MLKRLFMLIYRDIKFETQEERKLYFEFSKYFYLSEIIAEHRNIILFDIFYIIGFIYLLFNPRVSLIFFLLAGNMLYKQIWQIWQRRKSKKILCGQISKRAKLKLSQYNEYNYLTEKLVRKICCFINFKVLSPKKWWKIYKDDKESFYYIISGEALHCCYEYSLVIAQSVKDVNLIWGAFEDKGHYYAHAIIEKNGYIFDTNLRSTHKLSDFINFNHFKIYKIWTSNEYCIPDFRATVRKDFRNWCIENNVEVYDSF